MENNHDATSKKQMRPLPWNKRKLIGPKPPLRRCWLRGVESGRTFSCRALCS
jgi:hypothetical protein